jgi:hypothetical protein
VLVRRVAVHDAATRQVVGAERDSHFVTREHFDAVGSHSPGQVRESFVLVSETNPEHRVGEGLEDRSVQQDLIFTGGFWHRPERARFQE